MRLGAADGLCNFMHRLARTFAPQQGTLVAWGVRMHHPALSLLTLQDRSSGAPEEREHSGQRVMAAFGLAGTLSVAMLLAGMPMISMGIIAVASACFAFASRVSSALPALPAVTRVAPEAIIAVDLRDAYRSILASYDEIERAVTHARRLRSAMVPILERCLSAVELCGRMALLANPLQRHLDAHDPAVLKTDLESLRARCAATTDDDTARVLRSAVAARMRELASVEQIAVTRDRIHARLELCRAALSAFAATIVKLRASDEEQLVLAAGTVVEHLDGAGDELEILESVLTVDAETVKVVADDDDDDDDVAPAAAAALDGDVAKAVAAQPGVVEKADGAEPATRAVQRAGSSSGDVDPAARPAPPTADLPALGG